MEAGGYAAKIGTRYEDLWALRQLFRLLSEEVHSVLREGVGEDEPGSDLWITLPDGARECQQCKSENGAQPHWRMGDLAARGVLQYLRTQLERSPEHRFRFISAVHAPSLKDLARAARDSRDPGSFFKHQVTSSKERGKAFETFCQALELEPNDEIDLIRAHDLLRRTEVELFQDTAEEMRDLRELARRWVIGDPDKILSALEPWLRTELRRPIGVQNVADFLRSRGFNLQTLAGDSRLRPKIEALQRSFSDSLKPLLAGDQLVPRPETQEVKGELLADGGARVIVVHGVAGTGKSGVGYELAEELSILGIPFLPLRLDRKLPRGSARKFGEDLDLPASPAHCLRAVSGEGRAVLLLDQLDALRWTGAHSSDAWEVCRELIEETLGISEKIRVVLFCRTFDLEHDPQISAWQRQTGRIRRVAVGQLPAASVREVVDRVGGSFESLSPASRSLLRQVSHLKMWVDIFKSTHSASQAETPLALLRQFWRTRYDDLRKRRISRADADRILDGLVRFMDEQATLAAPESRARWSREEEEAFRSLQILQVDNGLVTFCHQSYLDYLLAERLILEIEQGKRTVRLWLGGRTRQSLFQRERLRLILGYLRDENPAEYLTTLQDLLSADEVRFHLQLLAFQFLGQLPDPWEQELALLLRLLEEPRWRLHVLAEIIGSGSSGWLERLDDSGHLKVWLEQDNELRNPVLHLLRRFAETVGDRVAQLLEPWEGNGEAWARECIWVLGQSPEKDSERLFELRLRLVRKGVYEYTRWRALAEADLRRTAVLLSSLIEYEVHARDKDETKTFGRRDRDWHDLGQVPLENQQTETLVFAWQTLLRALGRFFTFNHDGDGSDDTLEPLLFDELSWDAVLNFTRNIAGEILRRDWRRFRLLLEEDQASRVCFLAMEALCQGPTDSDFADWGVSWLLEDPKRLPFRRSYDHRPWGIAANLVAHLSSFCSEKCFRTLESFLLDFHEPRLLIHYRYRREVTAQIGLTLPSWAGATPYHLLPHLNAKRRSPQAERRIQELKRKFDQALERYPLMFQGVGGIGGSVGSPISQWDILRKISDKSWRGIIKNKDIQRRSMAWRSSRPGYIEEASVSTFSSDLRAITKEQPERFARLALSFPGNVDRLFLLAVLEGLASKGPPQSLLTQEGRDHWQPASHATLEELLLLPRVQELPDYALRVCRILENYSHVHWSPEVLQVLVWTARQHPDPDPLDETSATQNLEIQAVECTRGVAGHTVAGLLFSQPGMVDDLVPAIESLVNDPHPAVRIAAVAACLPVLRIDDQRAVGWFLKACEGQESALSSNAVHQFLRYSLHSHCADLAPLIERMIESDLPEVSRAGAVWATAAHLQWGKLSNLFERCLPGSPAHRLGVARVTVEFFREQLEVVRTKNLLESLAEDPAPEVQEEIAQVFRKKEVLQRFQPTDPFLASFAGSRAFQAHPSYLLYALEPHASLLPFAPCILRVGRTFAGELAEAAGDIRTGIAGDVHTLVPILLRLYEQSSKAGNEEVHQACLDVWDQLLERRIVQAVQLTQGLDRPS